MPDTSVRALVALGLVALVLPVGSPWAQSARVPVRIVVVDTADQPVASVDVSIVHALNEVLARGRTDSTGARTLLISRVSGDFQVIARKIGFSRADRFFAVVDSTQSPTVRVILRRAVQALPTVAVTGQEDLKRKSYHIDADDIANSGRLILDGVDIVRKLRPDMQFSRMGRRMAMATKPPCILTHVFMNGRRVTFPDNNWVLVLRRLHPEHIAEMNYADCFDASADRPNANNALFVVLKPGVDYEYPRGSFVRSALDDRQNPKKNLP